MNATVPKKSSKNYTVWQVRRALSLLAWIQSAPHPTLVRAMDMFGVPVPQLRHELVKLGDSGVPDYLPDDHVMITAAPNVLSPVEVTRNQGVGRPPALTDAEANTLILSLERMGSVLDGEAAENLRAAMGALRSLQRERRDRRDNFVPDEYTSPSGTVGAEHAGHQSSQYVGSGVVATAAALREGVAERRWVALTYVSVSSDSVRRRELVPDQVDFINGSGYLWAREGEDADQRCFHLSRMSEVEVLDRKAPSVLSRPLDDADPFGFDHESQQWADLVLRPDAGWMFEYLPMWQVEEDSDAGEAGDEVALRVSIPDTGEWLERFVLGYSPYIERIVSTVNTVGADSADGNVENEGVGRDLAHRVSLRAAAAVEAYARLA